MMKKKKNDNLMIGSILTGVMLLMILVGLFFLPYDPETMNIDLKFAGISWRHPFGCDNYGRDIFTRVMVGAKTTLLVALGTVGIGAGVGVLIGAFTGYFGGWIDEVMMRVIDALFAFPSILLALVVVSLFDSEKNQVLSILFGSGKYQVIIALGIAFIPSFARVVRSEYLKQREMDYVKNAKIMGCGHLRIMFVHILPNILSVLVPTVMIGFNNAVLAEAGMSYLGIGVQPPDASLGRMLSEAQTYLFSHPSYALFPGLMIVVLVLGFSLLADGLEER